MARLRLFAGARAAAGTARDEVPGLTVAEVLDGAVRRYGSEFQEVLSVSRIWVNGEPAADEDAVADGDEVAVLPPVSGGAATTLSTAGATALAEPVIEPEAAAGVEPAPPTAGATPRPGRAGGPRPLRPVPPAVPHGRLGVIWGALTAGAVLGGRWTFALWLALGALVATLALTRSRGLKPVAAPAAALAALICPLLAVVSWWAALGVLVLGVGADLLLRHRRGQSVSPTDGPTVVTAAGAAVALAAVCLVLLDRRSLTLIGVLLALACLHDASRYLVGWGAPSVWEGRVTGIAAVGSATLALAVLDPSPLSGAYPWLIGGLVALSGAFGTTVIAGVEGDEAVGALRRLDTLVLAAPAVLLTAVVANLG